MKKLFKVLVICCFLMFLCSCGDDDNNIVEIDVQDYGKIVIELYPDIAPRTVRNFKKLVNEKFYDGLIFHRVIKNFMIQTGDPTGTGNGGSDENIKGEFNINGFFNSASSQFFIVQADSPHLDGNYAAFGKVLSGLEVVDEIASVQTDENDRPLKEVVINTIRFKEGE